MGKADIEDALKRLDRLTQEEAQMASVQLLQITSAIDSEVREIGDNVLVIDNRVAGVDERVAGVDDRVACVDDKVTAVMDGARYVFYLLSWKYLIYNAPRWKRDQRSCPTSS